MKYAAWTSIFIFSLLFGSGCRSIGSTDKTVKSSQASSTNAAGSLVWLPPPRIEKDENTRNREELLEALQNFQQTKSFRTKLTITGKDGSINGQIDVSKPNRFHGILNADKQTHEVIGVAETLYLQLPDKTWMSVQSPSLAQALTRAFRSAIDGNDALIRLPIADDAIIVKQNDSSRHCTRYETVLNQDKDTKANLSICVTNGLPVLIEAKTSQGTVTIEYFDYNLVFTIERPTIRNP